MSERLDDLREMRELLWDSVKQADPDKRGPLFARLESVIAQIEQLAPPEKKGDSLDEVAARRASRGSSTSKSPARTADDAR